MAEDPVFSGFSTGDAADTFAKVIRGIKSDMAAIEASAKNIERSLSRASQANISGGAGKTGVARDQGMSLGEITSPIGGFSGAMQGLGFLGGAALTGSIGGGLATAGLPDLLVRRTAALNYEGARFGLRNTTGDWGSFQRILDQAKTDFNVQNTTAFMNNVVSATQRGGMVGLMGGGTIGEQRTATVVGGFSTLAGMAGIDVNTVGSTMNSMYGAPAYYNAMAAGVQMRNPVTGELASSESIVNQLWANTGMSGKSGKSALAAIDRDYGYGGMGRAQLLEMFNGDENAVDSIVAGMRLRAENGGQSLTEGAMEEAAAGIIKDENYQGSMSERRLEAERLDLLGEYVNDSTRGIARANDAVSDAVERLTELDGPLKDIVSALTDAAGTLDTLATDLPKTTSGLTKFFSGLPNFLFLSLGGNGGLLKGLLARLGLPALAAGGGATAAAVALPVAAVATAAYIHYKDQKTWTTEETVAAAKAAEGNAPGMYGSSSGLPSYQGNWSTGGHSKGDWFVESDQDTRIHYGEMVLPNRIANAVREELAVGKTSPVSGRRDRGGAEVNIYLTVQNASDHEAVQFANRVKRIIDSDDELFQIGAGRFSR
jgi:hypothetical protein